jgi:hypothetical protein
MEKQTNKIKGYKYSILERMNKMPFHEHVLARFFLPNALGISYNTFREWMYIKADSSREISATAIIKLSNFFGCEEIEMFNNPFNPKSIVEDFEDYKRGKIIAPNRC